MNVVINRFVTGLEKTSLINTKYPCSYYSTYLLFCMGYMYVYKTCSFIGLLMESYIASYVYDEILVTILSKDRKLLHFKVSKLGQIICINKTVFFRPSHIYNRCSVWSLKTAGSQCHFTICLQVYTTHDANGICDCLCENPPC